MPPWNNAMAGAGGQLAGAMGQKRMAGPAGPPGFDPRGPMPQGLGPSRGNMMRPNYQRFTGGPNQGKPGMGPNKEGNMGHPPPSGWMGNYPRPEQGGGVVGPRPMPQRPQMPPRYGEGTGSRSRTSNDWARRNPNDPGPMGPRPNMQQNLMQQMQQRKQQDAMQQMQQMQQQDPRMQQIEQMRQAVPMAERNAMMQNAQQDPRMLAMQQQRQQMGRMY